MNIELLKRLTQASGASGFEDEIRTVIIDLLKEIGVDYKIDKIGNVIGYKKGNLKGNKKILVEAHMDEIGLVVTRIEDDGYLRFTTTGGIDYATLPAQEVLIKGKINGVIGAIPPHYLRGKEPEKTIKIEDLFIDIGMTKKEIEKNINIGDPVTIKRTPVELKNNLFSSKALDDRASVAVLIEVLKGLKDISHSADVYCVAACGEETTGIGAITSTYNVTPDSAICVDVTHGDSPGLKEGTYFQIGKGPTIVCGPNITNSLFEKLTKIANEQDIPHQIEPAPGPTGTDARNMQLVRAGVPTALIGLPLRYMHTSVETINTKDIERAARIIIEYIISESC